jgi:serine/threonine-protein kinase ULK4
MLNLAISQPDLSMRAKAALSEERSLVPSLMALLDHTLPVLRAKVGLTGDTGRQTDRQTDRHKKAG